MRRPQAALYTSLDEFLRRRAVELRNESAVRDGLELWPPIVELYLTGVLPFERTALDMAAMEALLQEAFTPLVGMVKNFTQAADYAVEVDDTLTRADLERRVLADLFARDARYAASSERWADLALAIKQLAVQAAPPQAILAELAQQMAAIKTATVDRGDS